MLVLSSGLNYLPYFRTARVYQSRISARSFIQLSLALPKNLPNSSFNNLSVKFCIQLQHLIRTKLREAKKKFSIKRNSLVENCKFEFEYSFCWIEANSRSPVWQKSTLHSYSFPYRGDAWLGLQPRQLSRGTTSAGTCFFGEEEVRVLLCFDWTFLDRTFFLFHQK